MHIVHIASELAPIAKVGGLADVIYGLSRELSSLGHTVEVVIPKYDCLHFHDLKDLKIEQRELWTEGGTTPYSNTIWSATLDGLKVLLIEPHHPKHYFSRGMIYGCPDDSDRFCYFSKVALEYLLKREPSPDIIHSHDWPTALLPVLSRTLHPKSNIKNIFTIHNMQHQGVCSKKTLVHLGLYKKLAKEAPKIHDPKNPLLINLLRGGIEYADLITTVSPTYEKEIQLPEGGFGLEKALVDNRHKLRGILNGIDEHFWNPEIDPHLAKRYPTHEITKNNLSTVLDGKRENKRHLQNHLRLKTSDAPLVACVSRLVPQKSPELIAYAFEHTLEKGGQFVLLGSTNDPPLLDAFQLLQEQYGHAENGAILLDHDEALAHLIFAAADLFVIPSLFEPCGLTQLIALRYGTIPVARLTGGLKDTVFDCDTSTRPLEERNGFTFEFADTQGVDWALERALECYQNNPEKWHALILNGMRMDLSWKHAAQEYVKAYIDR